MNSKNHLVKLLVQVLDRVRFSEEPRRGRPVTYSVLTILKWALVMVYYRLSSLRSLERFLHQNREIAKACGLEERIPSYRTFSRRFQVLEQPLWTLARKLLRSLVHRRWISRRFLLIDATLLAAKGHPPRVGRWPRPATDTEACWGFSPSDGWVWGYRLHGIVTGGLATVPVAWRLTIAKAHEARQVSTLLRQVSVWHHTRRGFLIGDGAYDGKRTVNLAAEKRYRLVTNMYIRRWGKKAMHPIRRKRWRFIHSEQGERLLRKRTAIERFWAIAQRSVPSGSASGQGYKPSADLCQPCDAGLHSRSRLQRFHAKRAESHQIAGRLASTGYNKGYS